ncbi:uncharacterized protein LOC117817472 isoform X1 [Notolabrus celidotus]|uniref:uncharacterized protein LOC117817472 isoform X1 n=1 Tax=Notolabrus celidotus TaxID=1203425 RepID=UPI00148F5AB4|nr:uncharacterized protein LOC117817472 isoform X1 [Notolabrus celidotus]
MRWTCKLCTFFCGNRKRIFEHYESSHRHYGANCPLPCIYTDCAQYFRSKKSLQIHLRDHGIIESGSTGLVGFKLKCSLCDFNEQVGLKQYITHLGKHLRNKESVICPFNQCPFKSSKFSSFSSHKCRCHPHCTLKDFKTELIVQESVTDDLTESEIAVELQSNVGDSDIPVSLEDYSDIETAHHDTAEKIQGRLGSLLLRMQAVLHVSKLATQEIVSEFYEIGVLIGHLNEHTVKNVLGKHCCNTDENSITLVTEALHSLSPLDSISESGCLGSDQKRLCYFKEKFGVIDPIEYVLDLPSKKTFVYVPVLKTLQVLLNRGDIIDKILEEASTGSKPGHYKASFDGSYFKENPLLSGENQCISLALYIDDFEVCNPLGTSRKKHKLCAIYWVIANLPVKYRSSLSSIYLALLCRSVDAKTFGYENIVEPLLRDIKLLENQGIYISRLGTSVRGTVLYVSSDNLGAHSFAGFQESFNVDKFCRFCLASRSDIQSCSVQSGSFLLRTKESHNENLYMLRENEKLKSIDGVKRDCVLNRLSYFHCITGFPPDLLHDLLEGIVPLELCLCLKKFIGKKYFTLHHLNTVIQRFPYKFSDKTNRPQKLSEKVLVSETIGGNGHENWTLLRLLPLLIGDVVPENDDAWCVILELKDIVELLASSTFTEESLCYLEGKISEHRKLLQNAFPGLRLKPKHHFLEHYPHLIRCFGPLVDFWTIRFEAKHSFFKKVVRDVNNFKNILLTLSLRHQLMLAYYLDVPNLFKPTVEVKGASNVSVDILTASVKQVIKKKFGTLSSVSLATTAFIHGTKYTKGMFVSIGSTSGLPDFCKVVHVLLVCNKLFFVVEPFSAWYLEHLRCYEVCKRDPAQLIVAEPEELNHYTPLTAYTVQERFLVSPKVFLVH